MIKCPQQEESTKRGDLEKENDLGNWGDGVCERERVTGPPH